MAKGVTVGPFLFGARADMAAFVGSAALALALVGLRRSLGLPPELPEWGWVVFVLGVDVAHVYATLFRTYLDGDELRRHRARYLGVPIAVYAVGVLLHSASALTFWRVLAYLAVAHFVRQQIGWAALYRARSGAGRLDKVVDDAALYAATGYPLLVWHAHLHDTEFAWFVRGDFVDVSRAVGPWVAVARILWGAALLAFALRQLFVLVGEKRFDAGKIAVVATTAVVWYVGIVGGASDFDFTVTNVVTHGVPYMVLLYSYGRATARAGRRSRGAAVAACGPLAFVGLLFLCALLEEAGWDRMIFHDHEWLFGLGNGAFLGVSLAFLVPLLAVPQATHYVLDGLLWRRREPALRVLSGFLPSGTSEALQ